MIPTREQINGLWQKYRFPELKRIHVTWVARVALFFAEKLSEQGIAVDSDLLEAAALLHDIDKNIPKLPDESHPDAGVRVLREAGFDEVADLVRTHPLHSILDPAIRPETWEQKLLYLSDKMVKHEVITVDRRFALWRAEDLDAGARNVLEKCYPLVKSLEKDVLLRIGVLPSEVAKLVRARYT